MGVVSLGLTGFNLRRRLLAQQVATEEAKNAQTEQVLEAAAESDDAGVEKPRRRRKKEG